MDSDQYRVRRFLRPYRVRLAVVLLVMIVTTFLGLLNPWFLEQLIDNIILARRPELLWVFAGSVLGVAGARFLLGLVQSYLYAAVTSRVLFDLRRDFLDHLQGLSLRFFTRTRFGEISSRFNRDLAQVQEISTGALLRFITSVLTLLGTVGFALYYNWILFLIGAIPVPLALWVAQRFRNPLRRATRRLRDTAAALSSLVVETITGNRTVRTLGREDEELARFSEKGEELIDGVLGFQLTQSLAGGLPRLLLVVSTITVYVVGAQWVLRDAMELGDLVAMGMYMGMVYNPLQGLIELYLQLVQARVALERVREIRDLKPDIYEDPQAIHLDPVRGEVRFVEVCFRHHPTQPLLEGVTFEIRAGETVALVGRSGSGKSTLIDLLYRFYDPDSGFITIDDHDLREIHMRRLRERMAVVSQDTFLFHDTLFENIRFGDPEANREQILEAAEIAGIPAFLAELSDGMETQLGERGTVLSGGQRQQVSIARALLRRPQILILDEATSSLDYAADREIREGIERLRGASTTLVISHRVDQLESVDRVFVLDGGSIAQSGTPLELAARSGPYRALLAEANSAP